ncbi:MAG: deoxyribose-phosphate aldolase [Chloroflexi bacterium]|nr:deoxyribose-phosphate aldolase [Chloroflexota bacterium]
MTLVSPPVVSSARDLTRAELAKKIQFTLVKANATRAEMIAHCEAGVRSGFHAVMIPMCWVPLARDIARGTGVRVATFIGLSMGHESLHAKIALIRECRALGADEVDYEPNMGFFLSGMVDEFRHEGEALVEAAAGMPIKTMLELGYIESEADQRLAARLLDEAGVPWIKNSSGVGPGSVPATPENIRLLRESVTRARVKASGKVNSYERAIAVLNAGAELVGTSAGLAILDGMQGEDTGY